MNSRLEELTLESTGAHRILSTELVQGLWSGYGQILRCQLEGADRRSVIVKHVQWPSEKRHPRGWNSDLGHKRKVKSYEVESHWYKQYASECDEYCRVPKCVAQESRGDEVYIVMEDLDDLGFSVRSSNATDAQLKLCLAWLAHFHGRFLGETPDGIWSEGTYWHLGTRPEELAVLPAGPLKAAAKAIDRKLGEATFQTFVHGDAKLANFCFLAMGGHVAAVDFQYVGGGCGMKDVAYLLGSCLTDKQCEEREEDSLAFYFSQLEVALKRREKQVDFSSLERQWRALYPVAWTDFTRFLKGWSPGHWKLHRYSERLAQEVLASL